MKLDNRTCEVLEAVLSRISSITLKLERTTLEDEVCPRANALYTI